MLRIAKKCQDLQKNLKKFNRTICDRFKYRTIRSKYIVNYIIDNYNKINVKKFKNIIASIEQEFLKIKIKDYFRKYNLIRILNAKLEKICQTKI